MLSLGHALMISLTSLLFLTIACWWGKHVTHPSCNIGIKQLDMSCSIGVKQLEMSCRIGIKQLDVSQEPTPALGLSTIVCLITTRIDNPGHAYTFVQHIDNPRGFEALHLQEWQGITWNGLEQHLIYRLSKAMKNPALRGPR